VVKKNRIQELRTALGLTQRQLASMVGTSQQQIQRLETGLQAARLDLAARICSALGKPIQQVFPATKKGRYAIAWQERIFRLFDD
jgi:DNA-binding XRE family transcriptional regulator